MLKLRFEVEDLPRSNDVFAAQIDKIYESIASAGSIEADLEEAVAFAMDRFEGLSREDMIRSLCLQGLARYTKPFRRRDIIDSYAQGDRGRNEGQGRRERNDRQERHDRPRRDRGERSERQARPRRDDFEPRQARGDRPRRDREERYDRGDRPQRDARRGDRNERPQQRDNGARRDTMSVGSNQLQRITVNAGSKNGLRAEVLQGLLSKNRLNSSQVSRIKVDGDYASFDVKPQSVDAALKAFKGFKLDGKRVSARKQAG